MSGPCKPAVQPSLIYSVPLTLPSCQSLPSAPVVRPLFLSSPITTLHPSLDCEPRHHPVCPSSSPLGQLELSNSSMSVHPSISLCHLLLPSLPALSCSHSMVLCYNPLQTTLTPLFFPPCYHICMTKHRYSSNPTFGLSGCLQLSY